MKSLIYIFLIFCFTIIDCHSQELKLGIKGGFSLVNFNGYRNYYGDRDTFHGGIFVEKIHSEKISWRFEGLYSQKGPHVYVRNAPGSRVEAPLHLHYLDLPALVKYQIIEDIYLFAGPQMSVLIAQNIKLYGGEKDLDSPVNGSNVELSGVIGFSFDIFNKITFDIRYNRGLLVGPAGSLKNQAFQASVGYLLLGK